jgi:molecular chaperone DnaJ
MHRDPWSILGVARDSTPAAWKRAYRKLAMRWHPDRNDHPEATERFKEIAAAYDALLAVNPAADEDSGAASDSTPGEASADARRDGAGDGANEQAGEGVGDAAPEADKEPAARETPPAKAPDLRINLELTLREAALGGVRTVDFYRHAPCPTCQGSGESGLQRTRFCGACHGSGRVRDAARKLVVCGECAGRGFFSERICPDCAGIGHQLTPVSLRVTLPPGLLAGDDVRLSGQGEPGSNERLPGDLYLTILLADDPLFQLHGRDLHLTMPVSALALLAGGEIEVPTLKGPRPYRLEAGPPSARCLRLPGLGYPGRGRRASGDLVLNLQPVFPDQLDEAQRLALLQADAALMQNVAQHFPEIAAWRAKWAED